MHPLFDTIDRMNEEEAERGGGRARHVGHGHHGHRRRPWVFHGWRAWPPYYYYPSPYSADADDGDDGPPPDADGGEELEHGTRRQRHHATSQRPHHATAHHARPATPHHGRPATSHHGRPAKSHRGYATSRYGRARSQVRRQGQARGYAYGPQIRDHRYGQQPQSPYYQQQRRHHWHHRRHWMPQPDPWATGYGDYGDDDGSSDSPDYGAPPPYAAFPPYAPPPYAPFPPYAAPAPWAPPLPQYGAPPQFAMPIPVYGAPPPAAPPDIGTPPPDAAAAAPSPVAAVPDAAPSGEPSADAGPAAAAPPDAAPADHEFAGYGGAPADLLALVPTADGQQLRLTRSFVRRLAARPQWELARWIRLAPGERPFRAVARALRRLAAAAHVGRCACGGCAQGACAPSPHFVARIGNRSYHLFTHDRGMGPELAGVQLSTATGLVPLG